MRFPPLSIRSAFLYLPRKRTSIFWPSTTSLMCSWRTKILESGIPHPIASPRKLFLDHQSFLHLLRFRIVRKLCLDSSPEKTAFGRRCDSLMSDFDFSWHINGFPLVHCLAKSFNMARSGARRMSDEENLSYVIDFLISSLCRATNKHHTVSDLFSSHN